MVPRKKSRRGSENNGPRGEIGRPRDASGPQVGHASCRYTFTIQKPVPQISDRLHALGSGSLAKYLVWGEEIAPTTGTPHLQGFINLKKKLRFRQVKELLGGGAHIEVARGTDIHNRTYCMKEGKAHEYGTPCGQGTRTDLTAAVEVLNTNAGNLQMVAQACPSVFIRYGRGLRDYVTTMGLVKQRDFKTKVTVYTGPPGCGKSRAAAQEDGTKFYKTRGEWWDGYTGQDTVIIDDFYGWIKYDEVLRVCDRYPHKVPIKGSFVEFISKHIIFTSNIEVENWYKFDGFDASALFRRITTYKMFDVNDNFIERPAYSLPFPINF
nr:MAG: replication-associated protein [Circoviridae sp.]